MPIVVNINPVVIQGGTLSNVKATLNYSEFNVYNTYGGKRNEQVQIRMYFDYEEEDLGDRIRVTFNGVKYFRFIVTPVATHGVFSVTSLIKDYNNTVVKMYQYQSGNNTRIDDSVTPPSGFSQFSFEIDKSESYRVNKKIVRFEDLGPDQSGDNYIELWINSISYAPPPPPPELKPWAIRKSGVFKTLNIPSGVFSVRKSNNWVNKSTHSTSAVNAVNSGVSRIRKSNEWRGQNKFGS